MKEPTSREVLSILLFAVVVPLFTMALFATLGMGLVRVLWIGFFTALIFTLPAALEFKRKRK